MVMISERSLEAQDRAVRGHWKGDLIIDKGDREPSASSSCARPDTLSRIICLTDAAQRRSNARRGAVAERPERLVKSFKWDSRNMRVGFFRRLDQDTGRPEKMIGDQLPQVA